MSELLDLRTVVATWNVGPCAEVRVGEHVTRYVRRGSGPTVVLLGAEAESNSVWAPLVESLAGNYRLVIPKPPPDGVDASAWLRGFVEGLGLTSVALVAGGMLATAALELATADEFTVRKLVLIADDPTQSPAPSERILSLSPEWSSTVALRLAEDFIRAGASIR